MAPGSAETTTLQPGSAVYGSDGAEIGTVAGEQDGVVVLKVGERMIPVAGTAIGQGDKGPTVELTRAALVEQYDKRMAAYEAELDAAMKQGAPVQTADNQPLGTIEKRIGQRGGGAKQ